MAATDIAAALVAIRTRRAEQEEEEDTPEPVEVGEVDDEAEEAADLAGLEDAARRSREASLSRAQLIDYATMRGVRLSFEEQSATMDHLRKVVLERLAYLAVC